MPALRFRSQREVACFLPVLTSTIYISPAPTPGQGLSPEWIYRFFDKYRSNGWEMLSGVMLCVAGTETMFAAMGHFSQPAVAVAFTLFAYPCLMISYLGQGAYLLNHPEDAQNAYFASLPRPIFWPMLILATLAAIVASQVSLSRPRALQSVWTGDVAAVPPVEC